MRTKLAKPLAAAFAAALIAGFVPAVGTADEDNRTALPADLVQAAGAYQAYMQRASAIRADFADGKAVSDALTEGASYEVGQMEEGQIAYGALVALQDRDFVRGVRRAAADGESRRRLAADLLYNPHVVLQLDGAAGAGSLVAAALRSDGESVHRAGKGVKQSAYDLQRQPWSKQTVPNAAARLARAKALSARAYTPGPDETARLFTKASDMRGTVAARNYSPSRTVAKSLALAALAVTGEADGPKDRFAPLLQDASARTCLRMAKLNLFQCLAVSGPHYEDMFCVGQHALMDTGKCVSDAAAGTSSRSAAMDGPPRSIAPREAMTTLASYSPTAGE
ncbi:MAG TPA: hypothetical protein VEA15_07175 [Caulobacteraceae bacterium]|nr:hypothetical protein [Caulobacteraceae bacterium]